MAGRSFAETVEVTWATSSWMGVPWEANPGFLGVTHVERALEILNPTSTSPQTREHSISG